MNLQTPCWKIGIYLTDMPVVSILLFLRAVMKQSINWLMNIIFWNTFRNLSYFSAYKPRVNQVFKTLEKNFMRLTSMVFVGQSQHAPSYATSPSSKLIFQRINVASVWNRTFFFFIIVIKAQWFTLIDAYGIKPLIITGWAQFFCRGRRDFTLKALSTEQTSEHHRTNWESKNLYLSPTCFVWQ